MNQARRQRILLFLVSLGSVIGLPGFSHGGGIEVTNYGSHDTVRYPVVLLRGKLPEEVGQLSVVNRSGLENAKPVKAAVRSGEFKALVELKEGENTIQLSAGTGQKENAGESTEIRLTYKPQTNPHYVRLIWIADSEGGTEFAAPRDSTPQDYEARLQTAASLMQTFTAERMHDLGYGRKTFRLERDETGAPIVHTIKAPRETKHYYDISGNQMWSEFRQFLNRKYPDPKAKNCVLVSFTRKDQTTKEMKAHTALGGGNLGLFGSASVFSWPRDISKAVDVFHDDSVVDPRRVHDDSAFRGTVWALASTTLGATLHEMGHTFGLPHCTDSQGIMTRGFDRFNRAFTFYDPPTKNGRSVEFDEETVAYFAPVSASYLQWSRWFRLDDLEYETDRVPRIQVDQDQGKVEIKAASTIPYVGFWVGDSIKSFREYGNDASTQLSLSIAKIEKELGDSLSKITVMGSNGQTRVQVIPKQAK